MIKRFFNALVLIGFLASTQAHANVAVKKFNVGYYGFEPDIITNYVSANARKVGFVRITVELMVEDVSYVSIVEHHSPLLRDAIIDVLLRQPEQKIKSMTGREEIRVMILDRLKELMEKETGRKLIRDILFTKYLYH